MTTSNSIVQLPDHTVSLQWFHHHAFQFLDIHFLLIAYFYGILYLSQLFLVNHYTLFNVYVNICPVDTLYASLNLCLDYISLVLVMLGEHFYIGMSYFNTFCAILLVRWPVHEKLFQFNSIQFNMYCWLITADVIARKHHCFQHAITICINNSTQSVRVVNYATLTHVCECQ